MTENPLSKYYRKQGIIISLPSNNAFYNDDILVTDTMTGEIPVFAMTSSDEMILKNPDALLNNYSIDKLIRSCVPSIKKPSELLSIDIDALIIAIRISTYGSKTSIDAPCPSCKEESEFDLDLNYIIANAPKLQSEYKITIGTEVDVYLKPITFKDSTRISLQSFEHANKLRAIANDDKISDEEKMKILQDTTERLADLSRQLIIGAIIKIEIPDVTVTDRDQISEYVKNISVVDFQPLDNAIKDINVKITNTTFPVVCGSCGHNYEVAYEFNPANFFGPAS